jgi:asparagine synthase (glutamine-hydrolysing)
MCGVAAVLLRGAMPARSPEDIAKRMIDRMRARGPDAEGIWHEHDVALGHRRLAVLDLDARAHQPMSSADGRYVISYNGEIYNYQELRARLAASGVAFRTTSDTEVVLELFAREGEAILAQLRGMFAFVIWDRARQRGFAARDPYGIKPLYYAETAHGILLASQVKALLATGLVGDEPDVIAQAGFWLLGSVGEPRTWYRTIRALPAGHHAWFEGGRMIATRRWCDIADAWRDAPPSPRPSGEVRARVGDAVRSSIRAHQIADVPVGVFLSGGVDSTSVAALMVEAGAPRVQGVTIRFEEFAGRPEDEAPIAARVAARYGIEHHVRTITRAEFETDLPRIVAAMDQPSIDGINTWFACKAAAEVGLKVVVSGVGGDEVFQGYPSFRQVPWLASTWATLSKVPGMMALASAFGAAQGRRTGIERWRYAPEWSRSIAGAWWLRRSLYSPRELAALMGPAVADAIALFDPEAWLVEMTGALAASPRLAVGQIESTVYLRNQLLRDSDWASMDHSVELRTPLVDARLLGDVAPFLASFARFPKKALLAELPADVPREIARRPKTGFNIPMGRWLRVPGARRSRAMESRAWSRRVASAYATGVRS